MVGGIVVETIDVPDPGLNDDPDSLGFGTPREPRVWINCRDDHGDECAIYVARTPEARSVSEGDSVWWQGTGAFWTPRHRAFTDRRLRRIGFSGVSRPTTEVR